MQNLWPIYDQFHFFVKFMTIYDLFKNRHQICKPILICDHCIHPDSKSLKFELTGLNCTSSLLRGFRFGVLLLVRLNPGLPGDAQSTSRFWNKIRNCIKIQLQGMTIPCLSHNRPMHFGDRRLESDKRAAVLKFSNKKIVVIWQVIWNKLICNK